MQTVVRTSLDVFPKPLPSFKNGLIGRMLEPQKSSAKSISLVRREEFGKEWLGAFIPGVHYTSVGIEPLFRSPKKREQRQSKTDCILCDSLDHKSTTKL